MYKKLDPGNKANYRPVSVLPLLSKVLSKSIHDQLYEYLENFLSELLYGFQKAHSTQHALFSLIQKWQAELARGIMLVISHDSLVATLEAYGLDIGSLNVL